MHRALLPLTALLFVNACATKQPYSTAEEINEQCIIEMEAARTAVRLRDKGKTRDAMMATLPALNRESSRLLVYLHQMVDETFRYPELNEVIYSTYRFEYCVRQLTGKPYPASIAVVYPGLVACQRKYGNTASTAATQCVIASFGDS